MGLSNRYAEVIAFERAGTWRYPAVKASIVHDRFGCSMTRYYQILHFALDLPEAHRFDPATVTRLRRLRDQRTARSVRR
jgi:hypothetical protein